MRIRTGTTKFIGLLGLTVGFASQAFAQVDGATVQTEINAAIASGATTYTLPNQTINVSSTITIPAGTRNFELIGQANTVMRRSTAADIPLLQIGHFGDQAISNSYFVQLPGVNVSPAVEGASTLTRTGGGQWTPGWYAIYGTNTTNDVVKHATANVTYFFKRELIYVNSASGNVATLREPLGRAFENPEVRLLQAANSSNRTVVENVTVRNVDFQGRDTINNSLATRVVIVSQAANVRFDNCEISGFNTSGLFVGFTKGFHVTGATVTDGNTSSLGYGIEFSGSRNLTVSNSNFSGHRWGVVFSSGNMDAVMEDLTYTTPSTGGFDTGHGTGEERITYRRCLAPIFTIANPSFRRGVDSILLDNCSATNQINIFGGASNVEIRGKHPSQRSTFPLIQIFTENGGSPIPAGLSYVQSLRLIGGSSERAVLDGVNIQSLSLSGQTPSIGSFFAKDWSFSNLVPTTGCALAFIGTSVPSTMTFENCSFRNSYQWGPPLLFGPTSGAGSWNITVRRSKYFGPGDEAIRFQNGAKGSLSIVESEFKGIPMVLEDVSGTLAPSN